MLGIRHQLFLVQEPRAFIALRHFALATPFEVHPCLVGPLAGYAAAPHQAPVA
jgi:hypothetical protein